MAAAGGGHTGWFKYILLQELFIGDTGEPLHQQGQQVVTGVGVFKPLARGKIRLRFGFTEEAQDLVIAGDPFFFLPDFYEPVGVVKVIGNAAGMVEKMPNRYALIRGEFREELCDLIVKAQKPFPDRQHHRRCRKGLADRSQLKDRVLRDRQRVVGITEAHAPLGHDLALFSV